jgi:hypothetical protein
MPNRGPYRWPPVEFALWAVWVAARPVRRAGPHCRRAARRTVELWGDLRAPSRGGYAARGVAAQTLFGTAAALGALGYALLWWVAR